MIGGLGEVDPKHAECREHKIEKRSRDALHQFAI